MHVPVHNVTASKFLCCKGDILASGNSAARSMHLSCLAGCYLLLLGSHGRSSAVSITPPPHPPSPPPPPENERMSLKEWPFQKESAAISLPKHHFSGAKNVRFRHGFQSHLRIGIMHTRVALCLKKCRFLGTKKCQGRFGFLGDDLFFCALKSIWGLDIMIYSIIAIIETIWNLTKSMENRVKSRQVTCLFGGRVCSILFLRKICRLSYAFERCQRAFVLHGCP